MALASVFISYRLEDAAGHAGRLYDRLKACFPGRVFIDLGEIAPGSDFVEAIQRGDGGCALIPGQVLSRKVSVMPNPRRSL